VYVLGVVFSLHRKTKKGHRRLASAFALSLDDQTHSPQASLHITTITNAFFMSYLPIHPPSPSSTTERARLLRWSHGLNHLWTNAYTLRHFETLTVLRFVLNTDNSVTDMRAHLKHIYVGRWVGRWVGGWKVERARHRRVL
jgi:hypothetical protein